ncbi:AAA family ATPase [Acidobacteriota bacterium]
MGIKKIKISNFKSFKDLEVNLNDFNILIGANASGKSNFIHIFEFLRDIVNHGLDNAISMQGDIEYLRNINIGDIQHFSVEITSGFKKSRGLFGKEVGDDIIGTRTSEIFYELAIKPSKAKSKLKIIEDKLKIQFELVKLNKRKKTQEKLGTGTFLLNKRNGKIKSEFEIPPGIEIDKNHVFPFVDFIEELPEKTLLLETPFFRLPFDSSDIFSDVSVYNFDPKLAKKAIPITGKTDLEEDGSNLAIVLKKIIENKNSRQRFSNLINDVLPFVEKLDVEKFSDKSLLVRLQETYTKNKFLPASLLSDGTLNITALIIALYFGKKPFVIIEEPERNIHPHLASKIVEMMREVSRKRQIIVTTHNPEIIKHAKLDEILFIARDKEGFSQITRPAENEQVKIFLENEMGMDELYVQNLLEL